MYAQYRKSLEAALEVAAKQAERSFQTSTSHQRSEFLRERWTQVRRNAHHEHKKTIAAAEQAIKAMKAAAKEIADA